MVDLSRLFQRRFVWDPRLFPYKTWRAELDAVRSGRKGMSMTGLLREQIGGPEFREILARALERDLFLTFAIDEHQNLRRQYQHVTIYVTRADQLWRVPAHRALASTAFVGGSWSESSEALEGLLLGYTAAERARWLAARRHRWIGDTCATVYTLVGGAQKEAIENAGTRYLGETKGLTLFVHRKDFLLKPTAPTLVPKGTAIARVGVAWAMYRQLFGRVRKRSHRRADVNTATIPQKLEPAFHAAMRSNVQFLTRRGWV